MASPYLMLFVIICYIGAIFSLETLDAEGKRKSANPYTDFKKEDVSALDLEDDVIEIALGDYRREVWKEIVMTPELKANKMSLNRKHKRVKGNKIKLNEKKETPSKKKKDETPFDKYLPGRNLNTNQPLESIG